MSLLDNFIGKIRAPYYAQITIDTRSGNLVISFAAQNEQGQKTTFEQTYPGQTISGTAIMDLLKWLKMTAVRFFGSESGGL